MSSHFIKFYPIGNADTTLITLNDGRHLLWDFANMKDPEDDEDKRYDLPKELNKDVKDDYSVVTFTHADKDHIHRFSEYFYLEHAEKYQDENRKKIGQLWVPAAVLLDSQAKDEAKILKAEARHRLKNKNGILVFSRPKKMKEWCDNQVDISYDDVKHLFVDAGGYVPGFSIDTDGIQFFVHSPFVSDSKEIDRNNSAIVVQAAFNDRCNTKIILGADCSHELWNDIITITKHFDNEDNLIWDLFHISHHCSYLSLDSEKGDDKTNPSEEIKWLYETQSNDNCRIISSSKPIPKKNSDEDKDDNPPHRQAANYYKDVANLKNGEFFVTMEEPSINSPEVLKIQISQQDCAKLEKKTKSSAAVIGGTTAPRAGRNEQ